ncbi:MAG: potassium channel protein [Lewinella sp.]|nr:potassium channel protein [Lewinella sp.]
MPLRKWINIARPPSRIISLRLAFLLLVSEILTATVVYTYLEGYSPMEAFYMTIITISTVGFTEVRELSESGRLFTALFILVNIGIFAYLLAVFSYYIVEGAFFKNLYVDRIKQRISKLEGHVILCGYGKYGKEIAENLRHHRTSFVILDNNPEIIDAIQNDENDYLFLLGDATQDEVLQDVGIHRAHGLISALPDDSDNLYIVLSARQLNPRLKIISRAMQMRSQGKLMKAGANHVVMPETIGGFYMATLINKPGAVEFFSFITNEYHSDIGFEELRYSDLPEAYRGRPISDMHLRKQTGANIIGYRDRHGEYRVNPDPSTILEPGDTFIVLGDEDQLAKLREVCGLEDL